MTQPDTYSNEEAARRRDEALRRALNTPPPIKPIVKPKKAKPISDRNAVKPLSKSEVGLA